MKYTKLKRIIAILFFAIITEASAQNAQLFIIEPFPLEITYNKTVNLIFPFQIKSVDKGSRSILAQKAKGVENILQVKAAEAGFQQTNLTVITADGKLYSFVVDYSAEPSQLNIELIKSPNASRSAEALLEKEPNEAFLKEISQRALSDRSVLRKVKDTAYKTRLTLSGLYVNSDVIFFRLKIENRSNISYQIESIRFFISDKKRVKRTAAQQAEIIPLYAHENTGLIQANGTGEIVFALPKFTLPDAEQLHIELMEKNGGRQLRLLVQNKNIIRAKQLQ
ncbi:conjugative transposon protein TraN [Dyadobacter sp. CY356]|uniref:conjugative transposon protein TraN n=1 Tax=Dyadobacter sp. CY356 TaxID=2906442 RepID=UPI001F3C3D8A|nr:conjugative transposon protein TraN [Dyadobacter sp. CY356]MCF0055187.1 conjugative transposon protein TraN [Dyadobacter sp. CY356]